jgi:hypothetical protein
MVERLNSEEVTADWPPEAQQAADMVMKVIGSDEAKVAQYIESAGDIMKGAASFVFQQITEAEKRVADIPDELLYADGGLSDLVMALVFRIAEDAGIEGADDPATYAAALDEVDRLAGFTEGEAPAAEAPPEGPEVPEEQPPQRGRPLMAG